MIDHTNWSQSNFYKTFNDPQKIKIAQDKLKVEKTFDSNCKRIFISLKVKNSLFPHHDLIFFLIRLLMKITLKINHLLMQVLNFSMRVNKRKRRNQTWYQEGQD